MNNPDLALNRNSAEPIRSRESTEKVYVRFINRTRSVVELIWINFAGLSIRYKLLPPHFWIDMDTFKTHPWLAQDVLTKDRMLLDLKYVYMPMSTNEHANSNNSNLMYPIQPTECRKFVYITLPLHSLRYQSILCIRNLFEGPEGVDELELPTDLKQELKKVIMLRNQRLLTSAITASASVS